MVIITVKLQWEKHEYAVVSQMQEKGVSTLVSVNMIENRLDN